MLRILLALATLAGLLTFVFFSPLFKVKSAIITQNQNCLTSEDVLRGVQTEGKLILLVSDEELTQTLKEKHNCLKSLKIYKLLPSTLRLEIEVDNPLARIADTNLFLTEQGVVLEDYGTLSKPTLYAQFSPPMSQGQKINDQLILFTLKVINLLEKSDFAAVNIRVIDELNIAFYNQQDLVVIFSSNKESMVQVDSLQQVLAKAKIDGTKIAKIDLRFDKPVIVYK